MTEEDRDALMQLQWATQALALDGDEQLALFPDIVNKPFELVDDFDNWFGATRWRTSVTISSEQMEALQDVQDALTRLEAADFSEESVRSSESWSRVRLVARRVLERFGWPNTRPPQGRSWYVPAG
jgi:hypothetical protein